jgi:hypothetical protein
LLEALAPHLNADGSPAGEGRTETVRLKDYHPGSWRDREYAVEQSVVYGRGGLSSGEAAWYRRLLEARAAVDQSPLVRVVPLGLAVERSRVRVELIALELRASGAILYWKAYSPDAKLLGDALISVSDERGAEYLVISTGGGGTEGAWKGEANIIPAPAMDLTRLRVEIQEFGGFGFGPPEVPRSPRTPGPWVFEFSIKVA